VRVFFSFFQLSKKKEEDTHPILSRLRRRGLVKKKGAAASATAPFSVGGAGDQRLATGT
jgi:hypothetical protein